MGTSVEKHEALVVSERTRLSHVALMESDKRIAIRRLEEAADHELRAAAPPGITRSFKLMSLVTARSSGYHDENYDLVNGEILQQGARLRFSERLGLLPVSPRWAPMRWSPIRGQPATLGSP